MKKLYYLLLIALTIVSCKKEKAIDYAIISGKITNAPSGKKLMLSNVYDFNSGKEVNLKDDGTFLDTVTIGNSNFYRLGFIRNSVSLYLTKGENLTLNFDAKKIDSTLSISGKNEAVNNYLSEKSKLVKSLYNFDIYKKNEADFLKEISDVKKKKEALVNTANLPADFKISELKNINYSYLKELNTYKPYHAYFTKNKDFETSEGFLDPLKDFDYSNEEDFKFSANYRDIVGTHYRNKGNELAKKDSLDYDIAHLKVIAAINNQTIKNKLLGSNAEYGITYTEDLEQFYKIFSEASTDEKTNAKIAKIYNDLQKLAKGNPSPKFTNYENNAGGTTSLDDLKGKYVYVDVWATWCGPCIAEIPSLKKVEKQYHNKNIEFVSISIDKKKDHEKWKKMIVDKELKGVQLFADNNWESQFVQDYMIKGIPRFILINPEGNIITSNAPRPSDPKLIKLFNELKI